MPPTPKHPSSRARRNRTSTSATLTLVHDVSAPPLPGNREWHQLTLEWWADVWASPMAPEYDSSDRHGLFILAELVDQFWKEPDSKLASEIRLQRQCFGLSPIDRRRLQWEIDRGEEAEQKRSARRAATKPPRKPPADPRALLAV